jgi:hypothetical protein
MKTLNMGNRNSRLALKEFSRILKIEVICLEPLYRLGLTCNPRLSLCTEKHLIY